nr:hypothetical protein [Pedobacter panaciterrae]
MRTLRSSKYRCAAPRFIFICLGFPVMGFAQKKALNIAGIHQLVAASKSEYDKQNQTRDNQALTTANEQANKTMLARLKNKYRDLQERYQSLGTVISAANIGIQATPMVNQIVRNQGEIYRMAMQNPLLIGLAYQTEVEFAGKARSLVNYLIGLCASFGAVNQMKASDRKILFDYILLELNTIQSMSANLVNNMYYANLSGGIRSLNPFQTYIDQDKELVQDIIRNADYLK